MYINGLAEQMTRDMRHQLKASLDYISTPNYYVLCLPQPKMIDTDRQVPHRPSLTITLQDGEPHTLYFYSSYEGGFFCKQAKASSQFKFSPKDTDIAHPHRPSTWKENVKTKNNAKYEIIRKMKICKD